MARVKKDNTSWKAGGVVHRDNRHDHSVDGSTGSAKKKNTKKWCKGVPGRHHIPTWRETRNSWRERSLQHLKRRRVMEVACDTCGKVFETDWGFLGRPKKGRDVLLAKWTKKLGG
jgi:hypothetical protein